MTRKSKASCNLNVTPEHIEYAILPDGNSAIYQWQKYWGRKPHNVVREFIEQYCPANGVVLDPFVGSGVTAIEALRTGRRAVVCDLNPMSKDIILATVKVPEADAYAKLVKRLINSVKGRATRHYNHQCKECQADIQILSTSIYADDRGVRPLEFRYECVCSNDLVRERALASQSNYFDKFKRELDEARMWWPQDALEYPSGVPFRERQRYKTYEDLFTPRNLLVLATIWDGIDNGDWTASETYLLKTLFRSVVHLCSRVSGDRRVRPLSAGWTQHSFWFAKNPVEINAWNAFERKLEEYKNVIEDWKSIRKEPVRVARTVNDLFAGRADLFVTTQDCASFLRAVSNSGNAADYVFTDPPYNGMIQYGELSFMWNAWRSDEDSRQYLNDLEKSELTENTAQQKKLADYYQHLRAAFAQISEVTKPNSWIHVTYSSPKVKYRNLTLRAAKLAGLEFEKLHFQRSVRVSKKALEQPFGSVFGDFIFRFRKVESTTQRRDGKSRSTVSFEKVVAERCTYMLRHRGEPTPMNIVVAECERELFALGFFDDDAALQANVERSIKTNAEFAVDAKDVVSFRQASNFSGTRLSLRVEKTVREMLTERRVITYTDAWSSLLREYPNSLTPDSASITKALKKFANQKKKGLWEAKQAVMRGKTTNHNRMIASLVKAARKERLNFSIGKTEKTDAVFEVANKVTRNLVSDLKAKGFDLSSISKQDKKRLDNIDLAVWGHSTDKIHIQCFEVETTTNFIDAFERVEPLSRIPQLDFTLVILAADRLKELKGKLKNKMTFRNIDEELRSRTVVLSFTPEGIEAFGKWPNVERKVRSAKTWLDLESDTDAA